ncbi:RdgB/HAM1 family non-canonical purine NTP pyrophosphatase [Rickettsiales bacterium]|nr:RdgB/HAM1 family non-canonical purine NTP pyrophosphatase [Rickettsiales bacterium]MDB2550821.1 RdgB/HAM1 family non-canonical purine NTP pyrophosphatase [Rickettsiales bacterium]
MSLDKIIIATGNKGKLSEISELLKEVNIQALGISGYNLEEPEENGQTFEENSIIKAKYYGDHAGQIALADDSGLVIPAIEGQPGIHSARWAPNKDFNIAFATIREKLTKKNIDPEKEQVFAYFICNLSLYNPKTGQINSFEGRVDGVLQFPPKGDKGFGYDPIFIRKNDEQTFAEINPKEKEKISHRADAFKKLVRFLKNE